MKGANWRQILKILHEEENKYSLSQKTMERTVLIPKWDNIGGLKDYGEEDGEEESQSRMHDHYFSRQLFLFVSYSTYSATDV